MIISERKFPTSRSMKMPAAGSGRQADAEGGTLGGIEWQRRGAGRAG